MRQASRHTFGTQRAPQNDRPTAATPGHQPKKSCVGGHTGANPTLPRAVAVRATSFSSLKDATVATRASWSEQLPTDTLR